MSGVDAALVIALFVILTIGLGVGGIMAARNPVFWLALGKAVLVSAIPKITELLTKRNSPEIEKRMHECIRRGGEWDNFQKKCK